MGGTSHWRSMNRLRWSAAFPCVWTENSWEAAEPARCHSIWFLNTGKPREWEMIYTASRNTLFHDRNENIRFWKTLQPLTCYWGRDCLSNSERPRFSLFSVCLILTYRIQSLCGQIQPTEINSPSKELSLSFLPITFLLRLFLSETDLQPAV